MNIDAESLGLVIAILGVSVHVIVYIFKQGELNQWRKEVDNKLEDMSSAVLKMQEIHNLEQLNSQKLSQVASDLKEHKQASAGQFRDLGNKIDGMVTEVIKTLGELAKR